MKGCDIIWMGLHWDNTTQWLSYPVTSMHHPDMTWNVLNRMLNQIQENKNMQAQKNTKKDGWFVECKER